MWIRSQDKISLVEIHDLILDGFNQLWGNSALIGEYSSKEKALKVLDAIENSLEYPYNTVFQMPQDDEVEV